MRICLLCFALALLVSTFGRPAFAGFDAPVVYCDRQYTDIDTVYWNTRTQIPREAVRADWSEVETDIGQVLDGLIARNSKIAVVKTADTAEHVLSEHPKSLYLTVVFSSASKEAFSTPLKEDVLAIWTETTRNAPNKEHTGTILNKSVSVVHFMPILTQTEHVRGGPITSRDVSFLAGPDWPLTREGCRVLEYNTDKVCTRATDPVENKIIQQTSPCIKRPPISREEADSKKKI